jgi:hypothetical protein
MSEKRLLSGVEFREICLAAAKRSADWPSYVHQACVGLGSLLGKDAPGDGAPRRPGNSGDTKDQGVQTEMTALYQLLDDCEYDFGVTGILAEAQADAKVKWE